MVELMPGIDFNIQSGHGDHEKTDALKSEMVHNPGHDSMRKMNSLHRGPQPINLVQ
jgi:hypothetical protein